MSIDRAGIPFLAAAVAAALLAAIVLHPGWAVPFLILGAFFVFFFRDPIRTPPSDPLAVLSPADGRVLAAGAVEPAAAPHGVWQQVSIFLSPLNVHVNRAPVSGRVTRLEYHPGRRLPAYRPEAAHTNEYSEIWVDHDGQTIVFRQVVGILARRVVCRVTENAQLVAGQRFGIMKFGSRMDVFVPPTAVLTVKVGDSVRAGESVIARLAVSGKTL